MPTAHLASGPCLLAADIGGTKTDLGVYALGSGPRAPLATGRLASTGYDGIVPLARAFLDAHGLAVDYACFDVAGPVVDGRAQLTHLPWLLEEAALNAGKPVAGGTIAVIAPGTGLGEAFLTWDGNRYRAYASEGGHASFGPATPDEAALYLYARERFGHVSYERVCSGIGMVNLYGFHRDRRTVSESPAIAARLAEAPEHEQARVIIDGALDPASPDPLCAAALASFVAILGTETSNLMLKTLSTGGVYIAGGIPARILPMLQAGDFLARVQDKGRMKSVVAHMPVQVVTLPQVALLGAASHGLEQIRAVTPGG